MEIPTGYSQWQARANAFVGHHPISGSAHRKRGRPMKTHLTVTILIFLVSIVYFAPRNIGVFWKLNAASQEQTRTKAPGTDDEQHTKAPAVSVIHVTFRPLNLALIPGGVTSVQEFRQRVSEDPTLHSFFGSCDAEATIQPLPADIPVLV